MAIETRSGGNTTYLQLDYGKKSMYLYSKDEQDGYEKNTSSKGNVSYRKYVGAVSGYITNAYFRDNNFGGTDFMLVFEDEGERFAVPMEIDGSVFQAIARSLENIDVNNRIRLSVYDSKSQKNGKSYFGVSLSYPEILDKDGKATLVEWGEELPKGKQLRNGKWDFSEANDEAYGRAEKFIADSNFEDRRQTDPNSTTEDKPETKKTNSKTKATAPANTDDEEDEDPPF